MGWCSRNAASWSPVTAMERIGGQKRVGSARHPLKTDDVQNTPWKLYICGISKVSFEHGFSILRFLACVKLGSVWDCNSPKPQDLEGRGSCLILDRYIYIYSIMFILYNVQYSDLETGFLFGLWSWQMGQGMSRSQGRKAEWLPFLASCFRDGPSSFWTWHFQGLSCWVAGAPFLWRMAWPCYVIHSP